MFAVNPRATRESYPDDLRPVLSVDEARRTREWLSAWDGLAPGATPLRDLPDLAQRLGVAEVVLKDESVRSPLGSFKALGAPAALVRLVMRLHPDRRVDPARLLAGACADWLSGMTVVCATDGNHGRALAAAARSAGCRCVIVLHARVSIEREQAIAAYGARIVRIEGNYDDSVDEARRIAERNGWQVVSDTSYEGYEDVPRDVMQGYAIIAAEVVEQRGAHHAGEARGGRRADDAARPVHARHSANSRPPFGRYRSLASSLHNGVRRTDDESLRAPSGILFFWPELSRFSIELR